MEGADEISIGFVDFAIDDKHSIRVFEKLRSFGSQLASVLTWILDIEQSRWIPLSQILTWKPHGIIVLKSLNIEFWIKFELATVVALSIWELDAASPWMLGSAIFVWHPTCWFNHFCHVFIIENFRVTIQNDLFSILWVAYGEVHGELFPLIV